MVFARILKAFGKKKKDAAVRVLVIDDEESVAQLISVYLEKLDCDITHAAGIEDATDIADTKEHFDLLIIDFYLSGGNGIKLLQKLRKDDHLSKTPVIIVSDNLSKKRIEEVESKFDNTRAMSKPFKMKLFQEAVRGLLEKSEWT